mmetsp:Transcript_16323/g.25228  ORF Transcript_16323/g.25228 Transcript_16323/m.25228 type:complete len:232 (+) Transcript_16323:876-1571(+)
MCAAVQAVVDCRYITLIEGALEHVAGDGTKERPLVDLLPPSQVGVGICHPRCAQQAIGVENIERTISDFGDLQVGKPALIHNMIFINRVQWAEPFILEDRRLPYVVAVKVCVDCVLPVRQGNHRVNQLHHLLKLNGESKVMGHDARIIMPGITLHPASTVEVLLGKRLNAPVVFAVQMLAGFLVNAEDCFDGVQCAFSVLIGQTPNLSAHIFDDDFAFVGAHSSAGRVCDG